MTRPAAVDTNVLIAALVREHEHHEPALDAAADASHVLGQVTMEAFSVLRRHFRLSADLIGTMLGRYRETRTILAPSIDAYDRTLLQAPVDALAGNIHDALIVQVAAESNLHLVTLDTGLHRLASGLLSCELLAPPRA